MVEREGLQLLVAHNLARAVKDRSKTIPRLTRPRYMYRDDMHADTRLRRKRQSANNLRPL